MKRCLECGQTITTRRANLYCGTKCRNVGIAKNRRSYSLEKSPTWKGGKKLDSTGYVLIKSELSTRKDGYIQEHRLVMINHLGRKLEDYEDVHHKNGIKTDNRIENLEVITRSEHMSLHAKIKTEGRRRDEYGRYA